MLSKAPNPAHDAIASCQERFELEGRSLRVVTQNIDELHKRAGSREVVELHGNLFKTRCTECGEVSLQVDNGDNWSPGEGEQGQSYL